MKRKITVDGNTAAANVAYKINDMAIIYPITPSSPMAETIDTLGASGKKNIFDMITQVTEMQSEAGAAGALHGALSAGSLATTFTSSQGLLLMIPNMYKIAGELLPCTIHVAARTIATHALSIFGDHSDVMAVRQTGFGIIASSSVQEAQDMAMLSHMVSMKSHIPFLHFFDGFRTSHELNTITELSDEEIKKLVDFEDIRKFKLRALTPSAPTQRGTAQSGDIFFQAREASSPFYKNLSKIFDNCAKQFKTITGRAYSAFEYFGHKDAEVVAVCMGSGNEALETAVNALNTQGGKFGLIKVRLYRPFFAEKFLKTLPTTCKTLVVLDRTKECGSVFEPLATDISACLQEFNVSNIKLIAGRYGLSSKEFNVSHALAVLMNGYNALAGKTFKNHFTVGIDDDISKSSLTVKDYDCSLPNTFEFKFYGLGSDGTVSANKNSIKIFGDATGAFGQAFFVYDSKKSGSVTTSYLRLSQQEIKAPYLIDHPSFVALHNKSFVTKFNFLKGIRKNGTILLNAPWTDAELETELPAYVKNIIAQKNLKMYVIDAEHIARQVGLNRRINLIMQTAFFALSGIIPVEKAIPLIKDYAKKTYSSKGDHVIAMNMQAIDLSLSYLRQVNVPKHWNTTTEGKSIKHPSSGELYFDEFIEPILQLEGDNLKVSQMNPTGEVPTGTSALEKRDIATALPCWISENCIQCNMCSLVCPHACLRPVLTKKDSKESQKLGSVPAIGMPDYDFKIQLSPMDCTGCGNCAHVCPAKNKALKMVEPEQIVNKEKLNFALTQKLKKPEINLSKFTIKGSQFEKPLFEFSGACAGCGETPYIKLLTQLFGNELLIANATGCSSIYAGSAPTCPYAKTENGTGPAWSNSLFEDNAEFGLGMKKAATSNRQKLENLVRVALSQKLVNGKLASLLRTWIAETKKQESTALEIRALLSDTIAKGENNPTIKDMYSLQSSFFETSVWIIGGDGWAYDIGFGGLDHVVATGEDVNILILDTEVYSNTGGQASKSTPMGAVAKFASSGKETHKKDLGKMLMTYPNTFVAQVSLGANMQATIKAFKDAYDHKGPSVIIAYSPCINHGGNMSETPSNQRDAVMSGYFPTYSFKDGKLEIIPPVMVQPYESYTSKQSRFFTLKKISEERYNTLSSDASTFAKQRFENLMNLSKK